jgi:DMSO/TMAO reductase YedYZ molybdopterin-dependent catalytic subunit
MEKIVKVMTDNPLNAETDSISLRSWITPNTRFFSRNQSQVLTDPISLDDWQLVVEGEVDQTLTFRYEDILRMPKVTVANAIECSGNGRSLLKKKARGNPWTTGGVGNAVWGGVWLEDLLRKAGLRNSSRHVAFEGISDPSGRAKVKFIRSIPIEKALSSTLLAYEMNGEPLPPEHGHPLRGLPLGWTGANCVKWLTRITVMDRPYEGHFMDNVYRVFPEGKKPEDGEPVTSIVMKSFFTQPQDGETIGNEQTTVLGVAYGGENDIASVEVSVDGGKNWAPAEIIGPRERWAWKQWRYLWTPERAGEYRMMARATDTEGNVQPLHADWNVLGYGNNGIEEHSILVHVAG